MKNILVGVTGGIAAYKSAGIVSLLKKKGLHQSSVRFAEERTEQAFPTRGFLVRIFPPAEIISTEFMNI